MATPQERDIFHIFFLHLRKEAKRQAKGERRKLSFFGLVSRYQDTPRVLERTILFCAIAHEVQAYSG